MYNKWLVIEIIFKNKFKLFQNINLIKKYKYKIKRELLIIFKNYKNNQLAKKKMILN